MRTLGLIPARGGSKGVPGKNGRALGGRPLLVWTVESALAATSLDAVVLTTDDRRLADIGREAGAEVPFLRPAELATDASPTIEAVVHAVTWLAADGRQFDAVCLLQPTSPFRAAGLVDECVAALEPGVDTVFTVLQVPAEHHPDWVYAGDPAQGLRLWSGAADPPPRRQALETAWHREGSVYVTRRAVIDRHTMYGSVVRGVAIDPARSINIDAEADWAAAEAMAARWSP